MNKSLNIKVKRLPQAFITNITIEYNQKYLDKNIIQIYQEFNNLPDYETLLGQNIIKSKKKNYLKNFVLILYIIYMIYIVEVNFFKKRLKK